MGLSIIIPSYTAEDPTKLQELLQFPVISNILGRWIKSTDYGQTEKLREITDRVTSEKMGKAIDEDKKIKEAIKAYKENPVGKSKIIKDTVMDIILSLPPEKRTVQKMNSLAKEINISLLKGESDANIKSLIYAPSNDAKVELLNTMSKTLSEEEFKEVVKIAYKNQIISEDVLKRIKIK